MTRAQTLVRWSVVAALLSGSAAVLLGVLTDPLSRTEHVEIPSDELLAYNLAPPGSVIIGLFPKTDELSLSSWCIVGTALPEQRFVYGIVLEWLAGSGQTLGRTELSFESRVSGDAESRDASEWAARLAYSPDLVTDSRTVRILIPELNGERPEALRLSVPPAGLEQVLVRTTFPEPRAPIEVEAIERSLTPADREEIDRDRTSLPFDELSPAFRAAALSSWQRRLDARGVAGKDYRVTRLLIGRGRTAAGLRLARRPPQLVTESRALAYNLFGELSVEISAPMGAVLSWTDGEAHGSQLLAIGSEERQTILVGRPGVASTLVLRSAEASEVALRACIRREDFPAVIGKAQEAGAGRWELEPSWLRSTYYRLDPERPLPLEIAPGQTTLGVSVRGAAGRARGQLEARLGSHTTRTAVELPASEFERWLDGSSASEAQDLFLRVPAGVTRVELRGSPELSVVPFTYDPMIEEDRLTGTFQRPLSPGSHWRFADSDIQRRVSVRSPEHDRLVAEGRTLDLLAQARIVDPPVRAPQPGLALRPEKSGVRQHLVLPLPRTPGAPPRASAWVTLDRARRVQIASTGARAGQARLRYRIAPEHLGRTLAVSVDGSPELSEQTVTTSAELDLRLPPGEHMLALEGLGAGDVALLEVAAAPREPLLRQRIVYRLGPTETLEFRVDRRSAADRLIVFAYGEQPGSVALSYRVAAQTSQDFALSHSLLEGRLEGVAVALPQAWFWENTEASRPSEFKGRIALGADLEGPVAVTMENETRKRLWLSVVLLDQPQEPADGSQQFWAMEDG